MLNLNFGVLDVGYTDDGGATTTGDVAGYLEERYHIMRVFVETNEDFICEVLADDMAGAVESMMQGRSISELDFPSAMSEIEGRFREWLASGELQNMLPASQAVSEKTLKTSSRKKSIQQGALRQAFIDSGLFSASFRVWVTK